VVAGVAWPGLASQSLRGLTKATGCQTPRPRHLRG
jgi:hypothetical protein